MKTSVKWVLVWLPLYTACGARTENLGADEGGASSGGSINTSSGGAAQGSAGQQLGGGEARCAKWTNAVDCYGAGCMPVGGSNAAGDVTFECQLAQPCTGAFTCAYPPGQPNDCYVFSSGCIPANWLETQTCPLPHCPSDETLVPDAS